MFERHYPWAVVVASLLLIFFSQGAMFTLAVQLKPITAEMGWPREWPSLGYSFAFFGAGIGALYFGQLSERIGMGWVALIAALSVPTGMLLTSFAREPWQLWLNFGIFVGLTGNACMFAPLIANVARWFDKGRGVAIGIAACGQSLGGTVWPPVVTAVNGAVGWRTTFQIYAVACVVVMPLLSLVLHRRPPSMRPGAANPARDAAEANRPILGVRPWQMTALLSAAILCCCIPMSIPLVHLPAHGSDLGFGPQQAAGLLSATLLASFISRIVGGMLADRIGGLRTLLIGSSIQCAMLAVIAFERDLWTLYVACFFYGIGYGGIIAMYAYIVREYYPLAGLARRMAVVYLFGTFGMAAGGWLGGRIFDLAGGYEAAFLFGVAVNLINLTIVGGLVLRARGHRPMSALAV
jgi:MFS family permease